MPVGVTAITDRGVLASNDLGVNDCEMSPL